MPVLLLDNGADSREEKRLVNGLGNYPGFLSEERERVADHYIRRQSRERK